MNKPHAIHPLGSEEAVAYWAGDLPTADAERIEEHVFECSECGEELGKIGLLTRAIAEVVRAGRFHAAVTDTLLNRLARDGVRIRTYVLEPGDHVPCAVWADDDLVVTRVRAPLSGVDSVRVVMRLPDGQELGRLDDVPVHPGQQEIIDAISAPLLRHLPVTNVRMTLTGRSGGAERTLGEYVLEHGGALERGGPGR